MTKEEVIKKIKEILEKDKRFKDAEVKIDFVEKIDKGVIKREL